MRRREFLYGLGGGLAAVSWPAGFGWMEQKALAAAAPGVASPGISSPGISNPGISNRGLLILVSQSADPELQRDAQSIVAAAATHPLLKVMAGTVGASLRDSRQVLNGDPAVLAYNHLILVGRFDDPVVSMAWQREARPEGGNVYVFGYGHFKGDIGYIESDRNPFLHAAAIPSAPYETEIVTITGTTTGGISAAVHAFLDQGLVNGVVALPGWSRPRKSLLDRDPLAPSFRVPVAATDQLKGMTRIALTQAGEDEYRGVLADTGLEPAEIWRAKYYKPGSWDVAGAAGAINAYASGLHRRAYGNTLWMARFAGPAEMVKAATGIASAAKIGGFTAAQASPRGAGVQPEYATGTYPGERPSPGPLTLAPQTEWLLLETM